MSLSKQIALKIVFIRKEYLKQFNSMQIICMKNNC